MNNPNSLNSKSSVSEQIKTNTERLGRISKRAAEFLGKSALSLVAPLGTEVIQRVNVHRETREEFLKDKPRRSIDDRLAARKTAFTGSVDDFKKINAEINERKSRDKAARKVARQAFLR
jgi:PP-loop superfamily ATP-utilizing enzyme